MGESSYSQSFGRSVDKIRLLIFDRKPPSWDEARAYKYLFTDDELGQLHSLNSGCIWKAAAQALRILAADAARRAINVDILSEALRVDRTIVPTALSKVADQYEARARAEIATEIDQWTDGDETYLSAIMNASEYDMEAD